ncbi:pentapeptide repeat-containing protein [Halorubrum ezzemoulense]|uniref:pentapeptide repeat-containing protein n=1 Tax=Halorubrum ezzemoulense TaxID=337243 RepID=UPI00232AC1D5|nr:pentapeptide repeat-containing protein [Halorubrum ezzemoulense]MDB2272193.1 pentapeptide repeat-containing protein [Halorubrum ezzemoulense]
MSENKTESENDWSPVFSIPNDKNVDKSDIKPEAKLYNCDLSDAQLLKADLGGAKLKGANLSDATLNSANFFSEEAHRVADLEGADLSGADLRYTELKYCILRNADLSEADLSEANLRGADLTGADLTEANLREADFSNAVIRRVEFDIPNDIERDYAQLADIEQAGASSHRTKEPEYLGTSDQELDPNDEKIQETLDGVNQSVDEDSSEADR